jgi:hypothetical protein
VTYGSRRAAFFVMRLALDLAGTSLQEFDSVITLFKEYFDNR